MFTVFGWNKIQKKFAETILITINWVTQKQQNYKNI